jgi:hypothetical protein
MNIFHPDAGLPPATPDFARHALPQLFQLIFRQIF